MKKVFILLSLAVLLECAVTRGSNRKRGSAKSKDIKTWKGIGKRTYRRSNCPENVWGSFVENNKT